MSFFSPLAFGFAIFLPLIVALYLLKQKHEDYPISSLLLWQQALKDIEANAPWQKLRNNILMLLQLLIVAFLIFALAKPFLTSPGHAAADLILILDTSASMQMEDVSPSRFETAKREMMKVIENSRPGTRFTVVDMGPRGRIILNKSSDKGVALQRIRGLEVTNGIANEQEIKSIVHAISNETPNAQIMLFSDHYYPFSRSNVKYVEISGENDNAAISLLSYATQSDRLTVLTKVKNFAGITKTISLSLYGDEKVLDARDVSLAAGETKDVYWHDIPSDIRLLSCKIDSKDDLERDNIARTVVRSKTVQKVLLVSEKNVFLEKVLSLMPDVEVYKTNLENGNMTEGYGLYIYDGYLPEKLPADGNIMVFNPPSGNRLIETQQGYVTISALNHSFHPLMEHVDNYQFAISQVRDMAVPIWGEVVLRAGDHPVIVAGQKDNKRVIAIAFDIHHSDIPLKPVFPIIMNNFMQWMLPSYYQDLTDVTPQEPVEFYVLPETKEAKVVKPSGEQITVAPPFPAAPFTQTDELGFYTIEQEVTEGTVYDFFAVNFPAESESGLIGNDMVVNHEYIEGESSTQRVEIGYNLTWIFTLLTLIFVVIEWWVYNYGN